MSKRPKIEDSKPEVPAYIVTFSDMVTLLLTFFVLLLSLAETQSEVLFQKGQQSFIRSISSFGLSGFALGRESSVEFGKDTLRHKVDKDENEQEDLSLDTTEETLRRVFKKLEDQMQITPSQILGKKPRFVVPNIKFARGEWSLSDSDKKYIQKFSSEMQNSGKKDLTIYVVGIASDESNERNKWILSARRAQATADMLGEGVADDLRWTIRSWGAGSGGDWTGKRGVVAKEAYVVLSILEE